MPEADDLVKLFDPELIHTRENSYLVKVHLEAGGKVDIWLPKVKAHITEYENLGDGPFEMYVDKWILERREEDIGDYIMTEGER